VEFEFLALSGHIVKISLDPCSDNTGQRKKHMDDNDMRVADRYHANNSNQNLQLKGAKKVA